MFVIAVRAYSFTRYVEALNANGRPILSMDETRAQPFETKEAAWTFAEGFVMRRVEGEVDVLVDGEEW